MSSNCLNSFSTESELEVNDRSYHFFDLQKLPADRAERLPYCLRILLENLLRNENGRDVTRQDVEALLRWNPRSASQEEIQFTPARVILQDFTGVPAVVDLAVMRDAMAGLGGDPNRINPLVPVELVIDHSVQVDSFGLLQSFQLNLEKEFERNRERYTFLRWGQSAFDNFSAVPPGTGIVHQVNLEYLGRVVFSTQENGGRLAYPDTLVGTDSHTTMINGLGVLGWGVGGIEAEAAMLGQPISLLVPDVVGFRLHGRLSEGATATDLVLRITEMLRARGVVGKFVEFFGPGIASLSLADRATIGNMSPEYGATCAIFPVDAETLSYLRFTGRDAEQVELVEAYMKAQGLFHTAESPEPEYTDTLELDLSTVEPSIAGPKRPQDRIPLRSAGKSFLETLAAHETARGGTEAGVAVARSVAVRLDRPQGTTEFELKDGAVVIAAITSCTNTSNPSVMVAAGLLARNAVLKGLSRKPWVKTSLAPGSKVVTEYLKQAGLMEALEALGFNLVGYGCTTCIGNSGPLEDPIAQAIEDADLVACAVLSGNRNFEGRISPHVRANYLASPPLVVAYALAGTMDINLANQPLGEDSEGRPVFLKDIWPRQSEIRETIRNSVHSRMFQEKYAEVYEGDDRWNSLPSPQGERYQWQEESTYIRKPTFFEEMSPEPEPLQDISGMKLLAVLGDSVTTDHISPAGAIPADGPAGRYLIERGVEKADFNSFGSRRGNHEVMVRGTFGNIRLRNKLVPGVEGGYTRHPVTGETVSIFEAAQEYQKQRTPLLVVAGKEYGSGSSRDWAAKGTRLLGVTAVIAESFERIHRSNLVGMGVLPLQFEEEQTARALRWSGDETFDIQGIADGLEPGQRLTVEVTSGDGEKSSFAVIARVDTPNEVQYYRHGGILHYVLRSMLE